MKRDLYGRLFEASAFPLLDRMSGTSISAVFAALEAAEHLDRDEIAARQTGKLAATVELARRASPFYRQLWTTAGPRSSHPVLDGLPVVTKAQLAAAPGAFPLPGFRGRVVTSRTSGSTGSPMVFHRSLEQESWFWALRFRMWSWAGYRPGDPYLTINLNPRLGWRKRLQDVLFRCAYLTFNADNQDSDRIVERLRTDGIRHLNGFSSSLYVLARYMIERGAGAPGVTGVTSTGDTLFPPTARRSSRPSACACSTTTARAARASTWRASARRAAPATTCTRRTRWSSCSTSAARCRRACLGGWW